jgi:hypothetical protein
VGLAKSRIFCRSRERCYLGRLEEEIRDRKLSPQSDTGYQGQKMFRYRARPFPGMLGQVSMLATALTIVSVGVQNTIGITLTEFSRKGQAKCSVSGNMNVNAAISAF